VSTWRISLLRNHIELQDLGGAIRRQLIVGSRLGSRGNTTYTTTVSLPSVLTVGRLLSYMKIHPKLFGTFWTIFPDFWSDSNFRMTTSG